jgi:hypothetical protein
MKDELRSPKALRKLGELRSAGMSWTAIQGTLERELEIKASLPTIQNAYNVYVARSSEIIAGDNALKGALKDAVFDTAERLKKIGKVMDDLLDSARTSAGDKIAATKEILNQLYFQEKLLNRIQQGFDFSKVSKVEYTKISVKNIVELEKAGKLITAEKLVQYHEEGKIKINDWSIIGGEHMKNITPEEPKSKQEEVIEANAEIKKEEVDEYDE